MIVLDTNIISEAMRSEPNADVLAWLNQQNNIQLYITSISIAEIAYGLRVLPLGQRQSVLQSRFDQFIALGFEHRLLNFDKVAAKYYAEIMGHRKEIGSPMSVPDGQIAAITRSNNFNLATRNTKDFENCGIDLINPFSGF